MSVSEFPLLTSIPPRARRMIGGADYGAGWQALCVESWRQAGFRVISLNSAQEIEQIQGRFPTGVEFIELPPDRQRPHIVDFLETVRKSGAAVAGIINADCMILPLPRLCEDLAQRLTGLAIAERINVAPDTLRPTGQHCYGFDAFFFRTEALAGLVPDERWRIGDTWWDYWLPIAFNLSGAETNTFPAPMLLHVDHEVAWDKDGWIARCSRMLDYVRKHPNECADPELAAAFAAAPPVLEEIDVHHLSLKVFAWLRGRKPLWSPDQGSAEDIKWRLVAELSRSGEVLLSPKENASESALRRTLGWFGLR